MMLRDEWITFELTVDRSRGTMLVWFPLNSRFYPPLSKPLDANELAIALTDGMYALLGYLANGIQCAIQTMPEFN